MPKIVLVSDSHGNNEISKRIVHDVKADLYLHAGDSEASDKEIYPFISVRGNCDYFLYPNIRVISNFITKICIVHSNKLTQEQLIKLGQDNNCSIVVYGHTHIHSYEQIQGIHLINPGSITKARDGFYGYALLELEDDDIKVSFIKVK